MELTRRIALVSLLMTTACAGTHECPVSHQTRLIVGDLALLQSQTSVDELLALDDGGPPRFPNETERAIVRFDGAVGAFGIDDQCPSTDPGCVRIGASWDTGLTFRRPLKAGTFALHDLGAQVCERGRLAPGQAGEDPLRCSAIDGTLVVHAVAADRLDADLVMKSGDHLDLGPTAFGSAHLDAHEETVNEPCGGGCGKVPGFGPE